MLNLPRTFTRLAIERQMKCVHLIFRFNFLLLLPFSIAVVQFFTYDAPGVLARFSINRLSGKIESDNIELLQYISLLHTHLQRKL